MHCSSSTHCATHTHTHINPHVIAEKRFYALWGKSDTHTNCSRPFLPYIMPWVILGYVYEVQAWTLYSACIAPIRRCRIYTFVRLDVLHVTFSRLLRAKTIYRGWEGTGGHSSDPPQSDRCFVAQWICKIQWHEWTTNVCAHALYIYRNI